MAELTPQQAAAVNEKLESGEWNQDHPDFKKITRHRFHDDPILFAQHFLQDHLTNPKTGEMIESAAFHHELMELCMTKKFLALAAPRGHAKSTTVGLIYAIHAILFQRKKNIVFVSASEDMAKKFLRTLKDELEFNEKIKWLFGDQKTDKWSEVEFRTTSGALVHAKGRGAQLRGLKDGAQRPDLIICDDIEDEELVRSAIRRDDLEDWFNGVIPGVDPHVGQIIFIGTILHMDSLLNRLLDSSLYPDFVSRRWAAMNDENTDVLWPQRFSLEDLLERKSAMAGRGKLARFYMEYMNDPIPEEDATFRQNEFVNFEDLPEEDDLITEVFIDLGGGGETKRSDPTAMVVMVIDRHNTIYVNDYVNDTMGSDNAKVIKNIFSLYRKYKPRRFVIEDTSAARALKTELQAKMKEEGMYFTVDYVTPTKGSGGRRGNMSDGKYQRIAAMQSAVKLGDIKFRKWMTELFDQLVMFPRSKHDDIIDAMSYGFHLLNRRRPKKQVKSRPPVHTTLPFDPDYKAPQKDQYVPLYPELGL